MVLDDAALYQFVLDEVLAPLFLHERRPVFAAPVQAVLAISGAAGIGKSHFAEHFGAWLISRGHAATHVQLDGFLMERELRRKRRISGYEPAATDFVSLRQRMDHLIAHGQHVDVPIYDHEFGRITGLTPAEPSKVVLLDGIVAMHAGVAYRFASAQLFFFADAAVRTELREVVDRETRGYSTALPATDPREEIAYRRWIEPQALFADRIVQVLAHGAYTIAL